MRARLRSVSTVITFADDLHCAEFCDLPGQVDPCQFRCKSFQPFCAAQLLSFAITNSPESVADSVRALDL